MRGLRAIPGTVQPCRWGMATSQSLAGGTRLCTVSARSPEASRPIRGTYAIVAVGLLRKHGFAPRIRRDVTARSGPLAVIWASPGAAGAASDAGSVGHRVPRVANMETPRAVALIGRGRGIGRRSCLRRVSVREWRRSLARRFGDSPGCAPVAGRAANATRPWRCAAAGGRSGDQGGKTGRRAQRFARSRWRAWQDRHARRWQPWLSHPDRQGCQPGVAIRLRRLTRGGAGRGEAWRGGSGCWPAVALAPAGGPQTGRAFCARAICGASRNPAPVAAGCSPKASRARALDGPASGVPGPGAGLDAGSRCRA